MRGVRGCSWPLRPGSFHRRIGLPRRRLLPVGRRRLALLLRHAASVSLGLCRERWRGRFFWCAGFCTCVLPLTGVVFVDCFRTSSPSASTLFALYVAISPLPDNDGWGLGFCRLHDGDMSSLELSALVRLHAATRRAGISQRKDAGLLAHTRVAESCGD